MKARADNPRNLLTSLILISPLLLVYQVGVLYTFPMLNGADFLTVFLFQKVGLTVPQYLAFVGAVFSLFVLAVVILKKKQPFNGRTFIPVLLESTIYALTMGSLIVLVMTKLLGFSPGLAAGLSQQGPIARFVMSLGAGVYEETVFRLALLSGLAALCQNVLRWKPWLAATLAFVVSAVAFSAVHHIPPYGDPFTLSVFTFRALAGIFFGLLFWFRGFAVAVYTHALYDVYVLIIR